MQERAGQQLISNTVKVTIKNLVLGKRPMAVAFPRMGTPGGNPALKRSSPVALSKPTGGLLPSVACFLLSAFCLLLYPTSPNNNGWAVASLAVDDEGQIDEPGALQRGDYYNVDMVEIGDQTLPSGKFNGQSIDASVLCVGFDND